MFLLPNLSNVTSEFFPLNLLKRFIFCTGTSSLSLDKYDNSRQSCLTLFISTVLSPLYLPTPYSI